MVTKVTELQLHILHTNDVHSELLSYARLVTQMRSLRQKLTDEGFDVLCFDLGDHIDLSNPLSYATMGRINANVLNVVGYDGLVYGNNETVTVDHAVWSELAILSQTPMFCSNIAMPDNEWLVPSGMIFTVSGVKVGVCGVTVEYRNLLETIGVASQDPVSLAFNLCQNLYHAGADVVILLSHLGLHIDEMLVDQGIAADIIIGSHTHQFLTNGIKRKNVWIFQAGKHAKAFGHITMTVGKDRHLECVTGCLEYTQEDTPMDEAVAQVIDTYVPIARDELQKSVAVIPTHLAHSLFGESQMVNLLCDQMKETLEVQVAIVNGGVITAGFRMGPVKRGDLLAVCATPMRAVVIDVTGHQLLQLFSDSLRKDLIASQGIGFGFRGHFVGRLHIAGGEVWIDREMSEELCDEQVLTMMIAGKPIDLTQTYRIAVCEYVALSSLFKAIKGPAFRYQAPMLRTMLEKGLQSQSILNSARKPRYRHQDQKIL